MWLQTESMVDCPKKRESTDASLCKECIFHRNTKYHESSECERMIDCAWEEEGEPLFEQAWRELCSNCFENKLGKPECHEYENRLDCPKIHQRIMYLYPRRAGIVEKRDDVQEKLNETESTVDGGLRSTQAESPRLQSWEQSRGMDHDKNKTWK